MYPEIEALIRTKLPEEVGQALRGELQELARLRGNAESLTKQSSEAKAEIARLAAEVTRLTAERVVVETGQRQLAEASKVLAEREKKITTLELTAKFEEERRRDIYHLVHAVFRSPLLREQITRAVNKPVEWASGGSGLQLAQDTETRESSIE